MMKEIRSSMLSHIGWADDTLFVRYHPTKAQAAAGEQGALWAYKNYVHGLPAEQPEEGWGKWFNANVKKLYEGVKIPSDAEFAENAEWRDRMDSMPPIQDIPNDKPLTPDQCRERSVGEKMEEAQVGGPMNGLTSDYMIFDEAKHEQE